jgi:hypothetical protein
MGASGFKECISGSLFVKRASEPRTYGSGWAVCGLHSRALLWRKRRISRLLVVI